MDGEWKERLNGVWDSIVDVVPKIAAALLILIIGVLIAKALQKLVEKLLRMAHFDALVDKSGLGAPMERAGYADSGVLLAKLVFWMLLILVVQYALSVFGPNPVTDVLNKFVSYIPTLFVAIIMVFITGAIANFVRGMLNVIFSSQGSAHVVANVAAGAVWVIGIFAVLDQLGVAEGVVQVMFQTLMYGLGLILVISFGVGGIQSARDRFWPRVYDMFEENTPGSNEVTSRPQL